MIVKHIDFILLFDRFEPKTAVFLQDSCFRDVKTGNNLAGLLLRLSDDPLLNRLSNFGMVPPSCLSP